MAAVDANAGVLFTADSMDVAAFEDAASATRGLLADGYIRRRPIPAGQRLGGGRQTATTYREPAYR